LARLRRSDCSEPGIARVPRGRSFQYVDSVSGATVKDEETLERIRSLAVPPGWSDVWICSDALGHLQAIGTDDAGRRQYRYHERWLERRSQEKFDQMLDFAAALPRVRSIATRHLRRRGLERERVLAGAVRLLDRGFFRIGGEDYAAADGGTYGLATMKKRHVRLEPRSVVVFDYRAKGGTRHVRSVVDSDVYRLVRELKERRGGGDELLVYREGRGWRDVRSTEINAYLKELARGDFTAKDFRTWNGTVLAAVAVAARSDGGRTKTARKRALSQAVAEVAHYLGNTPAVARSAYIDPRVFDRFRAGATIADAVGRLDGRPLDEVDVRGRIERAVLELLAP
jgi:DNA topoisomerase-1